MRRTLVTAVVILAGIAGLFVYFRWSSAIRQPESFSHAGHVRGSIPCATCHTEGTLDSLPPVELCATCHTDRKFPQRIQWMRVYRVAPDIIFSHNRHSKDDCKICHESLVTGKRWIHESRFTMDFCMKCHEQRRADNSCGACHKNR